MDISSIESTMRATHETLENFVTKSNDKITAISDKLADLEQKQAPRFHEGRKGKGSVEYKGFSDYLRSGNTAHLETKSWTAGATDGSNAVPEIIANEIQLQAVQYSPIRENARVLTASSGDFRFLVANDAQAASWAAEGTTRAVTDTAYLHSVQPPGGEMWSTIQMSRWFLEDAQFDVAGFVVAEAARQFAAAENEAFVTGSGSNKPKGFTYASTSAIADGLTTSPMRPFGTYQHVPTGVAADLPGDMLTSPQGDIVQVLADTVAALRVAYLGNAKWFMNPSSKAALIRKRDADGRSIIEAGLRGDPDRLMGYPIVVAEHMPAIGSNKLCVAFGDLYAAYTVADRAGLVIVRDDVTVRGSVLFYIARRVYGAPADTNALKFIKCAVA